MQNSKPILLIEDDSVDAMTVKRALKEVGVTRPMVHLTDGEDALRYLQDGSKERPSLMLLDLNMPRMDGIEFLKVVKADLSLRAIPVVVLTTSRNAYDVLQSFELGVAGYMVKPVDYGNFVEIIKTWAEYWALSRLPSNV